MSSDFSMSEFLKKDIDSLEKEEAFKELKDLQDQLKNRYKYLVGYWSNAERAKSTRTGQFVKNQEVIDYLS
ncbi:hypothetical protein [Natroniella sp. ANB-PHB2]|uniref:hypothetical protein n=1 Tax=Natroniella sp. ANB-PHB2 TaxID=3384444 RepID=UPI0038D3BDE6